MDRQGQVTQAGIVHPTGIEAEVLQQECENQTVEIFAATSR